jgi:hypothetical protein
LDESITFNRRIFDKSISRLENLNNHAVALKNTMTTINKTILNVKAVFKKLKLFFSFDDSLNVTGTNPKSISFAIIETSAIV